MPAYHSAFNEVECKQLCGFAILPLKTRSRGPAPPAAESEEDIADEIIQLFRANVLFTNYAFKGNADRVLVYGTLFVHLCLKKLEKCHSKTEAARTLQQTAVESFAIPGDASFVLGGMVRAPSNSNEAETIRSYLKQLREAIAARLPEIVYPDNKRSKWWMLFAKRKFMNKELAS
uniref:Actin-related protein 2/3 complex subunit 3 n=1 Tax=Albugo laibachii Nc14 TaxID=890382 RepID=F0WET6_9STRA|nr:actinrelated protein 2/3 complex subunit 3 putative [Albugo laibachii Nc14]|eukprot:CCA19718.1 actinrelated protein 2/3 complex subunit 3 putative [Albugo laibachii Nc14]